MDLLQNEIDDYLRKQDKCGLKSGDKVKIIRKAETHENGWNNSWENIPMSSLIDKIVTVKSISSVGIQIEESICSYPYFVLEKLSEN